jgi:CBS domain-containing protein
MRSNKRVRDLMSRSVRTVRRNDELAVADRLMSAERIRHLPVVDDNSGHVVGVVSQRDLILNALVRALGFGSSARDRSFAVISVKEVMNEDVITTTPEAPIDEAARVMVDRRIGCLPVIEDGALVGILSESDVVRAVAEDTL